MKKQTMNIGNALLMLAVCLVMLIGVHTGYAQQLRWLRITPLQGPINDAGAEYENEMQTGNADFLSWPAQYSIDQNSLRQKFFWIGCQQFDDPVENKTFSYKVVGINRNDASPTMIFPQELKLIGKKYHPVVTVDNQLGSVLYSFDLLDGADPNMPADRMVLVKFNTSVGVSVTKKVMVFDQSNHDNYNIYDWTFKNTGIINAAGDVKQQTLHDVYFFFVHRYAYAGVSCTGYGLGWGAWSATWGNSHIIHSVGADPTAPDFEMRAFYNWYGPNKDRTVVTYAEDWGNPAQNEDGELASSKYGGVVVLHADKSTADTTDDLYQPYTNHFISADINIFQKQDQYDETIMKDRFNAIMDGHPAKQHDELVDDDYPINYTDPRRQTGGGVVNEFSFGPYTIATGDSIHIVYAEALAGISWEKGREVGGNWLQYFKKTGTPTLTMPDGSTTTDHNLYKRQWCATGKDSLIQTFRNAMRNYYSGYNIPKAPPPPSEFKITSGGDRIILEWDNTADAAPHFDGYVIYRSRGLVLDRKAVYEKIFECSKGNTVHRFDDITAVRGFDYYYYIQSKDDGTQNDVHPNVPLYSSLFWTITSVPATLQRPAVTGPPTSPPVDSTHWQPTTTKGAWASGTSYVPNDEVTFSAVTYVCIQRDSASKAAPDTSARWKPEVAKGAWVSGNGYAKYNVVTYSNVNYVCTHDIAQGSLLEEVRVVPNPYDIRARIFQFGDQSQYDRIAFYGLPPICKLKIFTERGDLIWEKDHIRGTGDELWDSTTSSGQIIASGIYILYVEAPGGASVFRKFVVIR